jgi:hypothetical protein
MKNKNTIEKIILVCLILGCSVILGVSAYNAGKRSEQRKETNTEIKDSKKQVKTYQDSLKTLRKENSIFKKTDEKLKLELVQLKEKNNILDKEYTKLKEKNKSVSNDRINQYTDDDCKEDVLSLKNQIDVADSLLAVKNDHITKSDFLIANKDRQLFNFTKQLEITDKIIQEKDRQIELYKKRKPPSRPLGIGIIGGYGTDFTNGVKPFIGAGISWSLIRL